MDNSKLWIKRLLHTAAILAATSMAVKLAGANPHFSPTSREAFLLVNLSWGFGVSILMVYLLSTFALKRPVALIALMGCVMMLILGGFLYWVG
ncbi:MAG TPA: hypothetical protein PLE32_21725 [Haliscomenobacter sp.]|nr:hypothetical protein [Haliscomenobacter sp.]